LKAETTECPFCGAKITPIEIGDIKQCPVCKREWYESGWGAKGWKPDEGSTGGGEILAIVG
jgi:ribosomal protein L37AE/L43A